MQRPDFIADLPLTGRAFTYAVDAHGGQQRDSDLAPFILHPLEVAVLLANRGYPDHVVAAGLLHDVLEDTHATAADIEERFGTEVSAIVASLSDDPSIDDRRERKAALRRQVEQGGPEAQAVFAADKVVKVRELRATTTRSPDAAEDEAVQLRLEHYDESLKMLERSAPELPLVRQLRFELWALRELPPQPAAAR